MKKMFLLLTSLGAVLLSGCSNDVCQRKLSSNVKGCVGTSYATVPAVRIPAMVIPVSGDCDGCVPVRTRPRYTPSVFVEPHTELRENFSPYPKTYEMNCPRCSLK
jgi:hypothetical protein